MTQPTYVFLSYAKGDLAAAAELETALRAAGLRVFRDRSDIRPGDNSPLKIHQALRECDRLVLPRYQLDQRFVSLTLSLDKGETEPERFQRAADLNFKDLRAC